MSSRMQWNQFSPGRIQTLVDFSPNNSLHMLRLDLLRSWSSGNKYYKLKYPLQFVLENKISTIVSKGGMFSNHLVALAEACYAFEINLICMVRSYEPDEQNPTLQRIKNLNGQIEYVTPEEYPHFEEASVSKRFPGALFIAEGGLSLDGIKGSAEITAEIQHFGFNHIVIAGGSMCTAGGLMKSLPADCHLHIVPAWKGCEREYIDAMLSSFGIRPNCQWDIWPEYHFGGFGKFNKELIDFMTSFTTEFKIVLDPVYTGKLLFAVADKMKNNFFNQQDSVLAIHTGGLQGLSGYAYRFPDQWGDYMAMANIVLANQHEF